MCKANQGNWEKSKKKLNRKEKKKRRQMKERRAGITWTCLSLAGSSIKIFFSPFSLSPFSSSSSS